MGGVIRVCTVPYFCYAFNKQGMAYVLTSYGEIMDKYTILEIKLEHIADANKLTHVLKDLDALTPTVGALTRDAHNGEAVTTLMHELKIVNQALWCIEDFIRLKERLSQFDGEFITLARNVYTQNDERVEEKSYSSGNCV